MACGSVWPAAVREVVGEPQREVTPSPPRRAGGTDRVDAEASPDPGPGRRGDRGRRIRGWIQADQYRLYRRPLSGDQRHSCSAFGCGSGSGDQ